MNFKKLYLTITTSCILPFVLTNVATANTDNKQSLIYKIEASQARLNRLVTGPVVSSIGGVPAEPVHSFVWDGKGSVAIKGEAHLEIDPVNNTGKITAEWQDENGSWTWTQNMFKAPSHGTGLQIDSSAKTTTLIKGDAVTTNVYLHGDTKAAPPVLPTVFSLLATWGPAQITLNGLAFSNPNKGPVPNWLGHSMTSVGVRDANGMVKTKTGEIYDFSQGANGAVDNDDLELHLIFHDMPLPKGKKTANFPERIQFMYHLVFEKVKLSINKK